MGPTAAHTVKQPVLQAGTLRAGACTRQGQWVRGLKASSAPVEAAEDTEQLGWPKNFFFAERRRLFGPLSSRPTPRYTRSFRRRAVKTSASNGNEQRPQSHKRARPQTAGATRGTATNSGDGGATHQPEDSTGTHRRRSGAADDPRSPGELGRALAKRATPAARAAAANSPISACAAAPSGTWPKSANGGRRAAVRPASTGLDDARHP